MKKTAKEIRWMIAEIIKKSPHYAESVKNVNALNDRLGQFIEHAIGGFTLNLGDDFKIWGHKCSLIIDKDGNPSVSWSSTNRSPAMARAALKIYTEACDLADEIQAILDCTTIVDETK